MEGNKIFLMGKKVKFSRTRESYERESKMERSRGKCLKMEKIE